MPGRLTNEGLEYWDLDLLFTRDCVTRSKFGDSSVLNAIFFLLQYPWDVLPSVFYMALPSRFHLVALHHSLSRVLPQARPSAL